MSCPQCGTQLENFSRQEGGWCPDYEEWFPYDIVEESWEPEDDPYWGDDLDDSFYESFKSDNLRKSNS